MPTFTSFGAWGAAYENMVKDLDGPAKRKITRDMAEQAQKIADRAAGADIGGSFSGWRRGNPIELDTQIRNARDNNALLIPTRTSAGPWTVAEKGRNQGNARGFSGPGINRRTGVTARTKSGAVRRVRATRGRRWNGVTQGKRTASEAVAAMERELPKFAARGVLVAQRKHFDVT